MTNNLSPKKFKFRREGFSIWSREGSDEVFVTSGELTWPVKVFAKFVGALTLIFGSPLLIIIGLLAAIVQKNALLFLLVTVAAIIVLVAGLMVTHYSMAESGNYDKLMELIREKGHTQLYETLLKLRDVEKK